MEAAGRTAKLSALTAAPRLPPALLPAAPGVSFAPPAVTSVLILLSSLWLVYARHTPLDHMTHASSSPPATATALDAPSGTLTSNSHAVFTLRPPTSPPVTLYRVTVRTSAFDRSAVTTTTPPPPLASPQVSATLFAEADPVFFFFFSASTPTPPPSPGGAEAASFLASAPNQRAPPPTSTTITPPSSFPSPTATRAAIPSGSLVELASTAWSREAMGSASVQVTSAGSVSPGGRSAAKYRPQPRSNTAGAAKA
mmetsp:Transcript_5662/g.23269  ORF Transcript_5662/g.23269 Transcript_5662/m.23269 type:complete len:254 (+) Transcript_5662:1595-2356(+)